MLTSASAAAAAALSESTGRVVGTGIVVTAVVVDVRGAAVVGVMVGTELAPASSARASRATDRALVALAGTTTTDCAAREAAARSAGGATATGLSPLPGWGALKM